MIELHCDHAATHAAQRADALLAEGDVDGYRVRKRVLAAICELRRTSRREGETVN